MAKSVKAGGQGEKGRSATENLDSTVVTPDAVSAGKAERDARSDQMATIYEMYVKNTENHQDRVHALLRLFLTLNLGGLSVVGIAIKQGMVLSLRQLLLISAAGASFSIIWMLLLRSAIYLYRARYSVIREMEQGLAARPFTMEWNDRLREGKGYLGIGSILMLMPVVFLLLYIGVALSLVLDAI